MDEKREAENINVKRPIGKGACESALSKDNEKTRSSAVFGREAARRVLFGTTFGVIAFLLGRCEMIFSTYPLGFALLSSACGCTPYIFLGGIAAAFTQGASCAVYICASVIIVFSRIMCGAVLDDNMREIKKSVGRPVAERIGILFSEDPYLRMMSGAVGVFFIGIYNIISGSFRFYDLFGTVFYIIITPIAILFYSGFFNEAERSAHIKSAFGAEGGRVRIYDLGCAALLCSVIYALGDLSVLGISLSVSTAMFFSLYYSRSGFLKGTIMGLLLGLAAGPVYAPLYAFAAIICAALRRFSLLGGCIGACTAGVIWGIYVGGTLELGKLFPALLSSSMVYCAAERMNLFSDISALLTEQAPSDTGDSLVIVAQDRANDSIERMKGISESFSALSEVFYDLSSKLKRPAMLDLRHICDKTFDEYCPDCDNCDICWGVEYSKMLEQVNRISVSIHATGNADISKLSSELRQRCLYLPNIIDDINERCAKATQKALLNEKTEIFALDYDSISKILNDAIKENELDYRPDRAMSRKLSEVIEKEGYGKKSVTVYGKRKKRIVAKGLDLSENGEGAEHLRRSLERACGHPLDIPEFELSLGSVNMQCRSRCRFYVENCFETSASGGQGVPCGDSVSVFENRNGYFYSIISDGMGTGRNAAFTSEMCSVFLRNMLLAGNRMETSLRMLNSVIRAKGAGSAMECSATVDLLEFDLYSGEAVIVKSGAAPTYLLRGKSVFRISAQSIPIGIIKSLDAKQLKIRCFDGDVIVMVSDGAIRADDGDSFLPEFLEKEWDGDLASMAKKIVLYAESDEKSSDDVSVILLRVGTAS